MSKRKCLMNYSNELIERIDSNNIVDVIGQYVTLRRKELHIFGLCHFIEKKTHLCSI